MNERTEAARERVERLVAEIMDRATPARSAPRRRGVGDLMVGLAQLSRPLAGTGCLRADRFVHRHLQVFRDGMRAPARSALPGATLEELRQS